MPVLGSVADTVTSKGWAERIRRVSLAVTSTLLWNTAEPRGVVTVSVTVYSPALAKAWTASGDADVLPSPKSQRQAVASLTDRAVNWTGDFAAGLAVAIENAAAASSFAEALSLPAARRKRAATTRTEGARAARTLFTRKETTETPDENVRWGCWFVITLRN